MFSFILFFLSFQSKKGNTYLGTYVYSYINNSKNDQIESVFLSFFEHCVGSFQSTISFLVQL